VVREKLLNSSETECRADERLTRRTLLKGAVAASTLPVAADAISGRAAASGPLANGDVSLFDFDERDGVDLQDILALLRRL